MLRGEDKGQSQVNTSDLIHQNLVSTLSAYKILNMTGTSGFDTTDSVPHDNCVLPHRTDCNGDTICVMTFSGDRIWQWDSHHGAAYVTYHPPSAMIPHGRFIILALKSNVVLDRETAEILNKGDVRRCPGSTSLKITPPSGRTTLFERIECNTTVSPNALSPRNMAVVDRITDDWAIKLRNEPEE